MSAALRPDAAAAHRLECPERDGVIRIIFRSDERYRGYPCAPLAAGAEARSRVQRARGRSGHARRAVVTREHPELDGTLRLTLLGDVDVTAGEKLSARLAELKAFGQRVRIDLSRLTFIDSSEIRALLVALTDARWSGWQLEVAPEVSPGVERAAQIVGIAQVLWPRDSEPNQEDPGPRRPTNTE